MCPNEDVNPGSPGNNIPQESENNEVQTFSSPPDAEDTYASANTSPPEEENIDGSVYGTQSDGEAFDVTFYNNAPADPQYSAPPAYTDSQPQQNTYPIGYNMPSDSQQPQPQPYSYTPYTEPHYTQPPVYNTPQNPDYTNRHAYYNQSDTKQSMYSPGIFAEQPYPKKHTYSAASKPHAKKKSGVGKFVRAACLVLVCVLFSTLATTLVINYRIENGDLAPTTTQVVLGAAPTVPPTDEKPPVYLPTATSDDIISAQDIYDIAITQAVGISITPPETPGWFAMQGSVPAVVGSGFIISTDGYILTNYHVIETAHGLDLPISVVLFDGSSYEAAVIGFEASNDVAVLKIDKTGLNPTLIGNSNDLRVGQTVYAVGNPFGDLVYTMTDGIVSAIDRVVSVEGKTINTFQFSAAVNSGNSGGPIYNTAGEVIGIVTAKVTRGNVEGIGFAIPINDAIDIASALIEHGYISGRPLLGVIVNDVTSAHAEYYDWVVGIYVREVNPGSAAEKAGILTGDIITAISDIEVESLETLRFALRQFNAGDTTTITIWRSGEVFELTITFDEDLNAGRPEPSPRPTPETSDPFTERP